VCIAPTQAKLVDWLEATVSLIVCSSAPAARAPGAADTTTTETNNDTMVLNIRPVRKNCGNGIMLERR
jgi:hypothetical protein